MRITRAESGVLINTENFLKNQQILCGGNTMTFQETEHEEQD